MFSQLTTFVKRYRLVTFFVLAFAISWAPVPVHYFLPGGPLIAAIIVVGLADGWVGLRALGASVLKWRVGWRWYAAAFGLPLGAALATVALTVALGGSWSLAQLPAWTTMFMMFGMRLIDPMDGPLGEEPGWRGVALPGLQVTRSPLFATMILGFIVACWHLPLIMFGQLPPLGFLATIGVTFWYTWLYNHSGGSVLMTLLMHAAEGTFFRYTSAGYAAADADRAVFIYFMLMPLIALALVVLDWQSWRGPAPTATIAKSSVQLA